MQAASVTAAVAVAARYAEFAAREGEFVARTLFEAPPALQQNGPGMQADPILRLCDCYVECLRGFAGLPRVSALIFLGELDRIRGPRALPEGPANRDSAGFRPPSSAAA